MTRRVCSGDIVFGRPGPLYEGHLMPRKEFWFAEDDSPSLFTCIARRLVHLADQGALLDRAEFNSFFRFGWNSLCGYPCTIEEIESLSIACFSYLSGFLLHLEWVNGSGSIGSTPSAMLLKYLATLRRQFHETFRLQERFVGASPSSFDNRYCRYDILILCGLAHKALKFQTTYLWNVHLHSRANEFPNNKVFGSIVQGKLISQWLSEKIHRKIKNKFFLNTIFMGLKKALPPLCPYQLMDNLDDLKKDLTSDPTFEAHPDLRDRDDQGDVKIRSYVNEIMEEVGELPPLEFAENSSFGASAFFPRRLGGQYRALYNAYMVSNPEDDSSLSCRMQWNRKLNCFYFEEPVARSDTELLFAAMCEKHTFEGWEIDSYDGKMTSIYTYGTSSYDIWSWVRTLGRIDLEELCIGVAETCPHAILEPLKVRVITKGDCWTLNGLGNVKTLLRDIMRKMPNDPFQLSFEGILPKKENPWETNSKTWEPFYHKGGKNSLWNRYLEAKSFSGCETPTWVSGDFSSATNKLKGDISRELYRGMMGCAPLGSSGAAPYWFGLRSLCDNHIIVNYDKIIPWMEYFPTEIHKFGQVHTAKHDEYSQCNGQLMGSIVSFPILGLANLIVYWMARELWLGKRISLRKLLTKFPVKINGDDILFFADYRMYIIWKDVCTSAGLVPSIGKNLFLEDAFTINSVYYSVDINEGPSVNHYFNLSFLNGRKKGDGSSDTIARALQMGKGFKEYAYSPEFWAAARESFMEILELRGKYRERAITLFFEIYDPYLSKLGWNREKFEVYHGYLYLLPVSDYSIPYTVAGVINGGSGRQKERIEDLKEHGLDLCLRLFHKRQAECMNGGKLEFKFAHTGMANPF